MRLVLAASLLATPLLVGPALAQAAADGPSYIDVLSRPDDPQLNFAYAMKLVRQGELNSAQAVLERLLLAYPEADEVRVTYMIVLFRLDDMAGAKREADILATRKLSGRVAGEYERYNVQIQSRAKPTRFEAYLGSGVRYDADATLGRDSFTSGRDGDFSLVSLGGISVEHDVDLGIIDKVFASFDAGSITHAKEDNYDILTGRFEAGAEARISFVTLRMAGFAEGSMVGGDGFSKALGVNAKLALEITSRLKLFADFETSNPIYQDVTVAPSGSAHSGPRWKTGGGISYMLTESHQFTLQSHFTRKDARTDFYGLQSHDYDATDVEAKWLGTFSGGQFAAASVRYAWINYDAWDWDYFARRQDDLLRTRVTYGVPVDTLGRWIGLDTNNSFVNWGRLVVQVSADYVWQDSNISAFDYHSLGGEVLLTRRWYF